ncbi:hypothetical protein [Nostoc sp. 'Peltigera malacea cyanobiont' DB3992]|uniref:hypothetical protein n=1 Tax=Nostoc sp. 'Peltigera malacea cyanobiont' DB3992 TaxID=1206980 RepID=UPI000C048B6C|nr:hypothetical protein [Nostoc sp. 'Peltigera malacea cyanobiont' DB3992]PHM05791.1 hypothetical protein CK516_38350 [Nostoc sp. 'Peltigera malacea cyanobiont' DB3992]
MITNIAIEKFFGSGVFQDANILVIQKSSLPGITPLMVNTPESLLGAILLLVSQSIKAPLTANSQPIIINGEPLIINNDFAYSVTAELWDKILFPKNKVRQTFLLYSWSVYGN